MNLFSDLRILRNKLLVSNEIKLCSSIVCYFDDPSSEAFNAIIKEYSTHVLSKEIKSILCELQESYVENRNLYFDQIIYGQKLIWQEILECYKKISINLNIIKTNSVANYQDNYILSVDEISVAIKPYTNSLALLSKLEDTLGVDRYLDKICEGDFIPLQSLVNEQASLLEKKLAKAKDQFQNLWGNTNVADVIFHKFISRRDINPICSGLNSEETTVLLFVIDGFGYCQYEWQKHYLSDLHSFTYNENIFSWLKNENCSKELILGAPFITDTTAGLSQIFTGVPSYESGMISSNLKIQNSQKILQTKNASKEEIKKNFNISRNCVTDVLNTFGINSKVYYYTKYNDYNSGFSNYLYKGAVLDTNVPQDRIFLKLIEGLDVNDRGLKVIYLTGIDNSGHTLGAFSKFERYEHAKLQSLFKNFIIELAQNNTDIFDGKTSILITADHGMTETARKFISRNQLDDCFVSQNIFGAIFAIDNRAVLIYNIPEKLLEKAKLTLKLFFEKESIEVDIKAKIDDEFQKYLPISSPSASIFPDIVVRMVGNGLFVVNQSHAMNRHLMHFGGHGGSSINEVFVPLIEINLNPTLFHRIQDRIIKLS